MNRQHLTEIHRSGRAARRDHVDFFDCPFNGPEYNSMPFEQWCSASMTWQAGWVAEDNGRDQKVQRFLRHLERTSVPGFFCN